MYAVARRLKDKYQVGDPRADLVAAADQWVRAPAPPPPLHLTRPPLASQADAVGSRRFLGGDRPNLADLSVFGVLKSLEGLSYEARRPLPARPHTLTWLLARSTGQELLQRSRVRPWYERMVDAVGGSMAQELQ